MAVEAPVPTHTAPPTTVDGQPAPPITTRRALLGLGLGNTLE